jgi:hypothetical protein
MLWCRQTPMPAWMAGLRPCCSRLPVQRLCWGWDPSQAGWPAAQDRCAQQSTPSWLGLGFHMASGPDMLCLMGCYCHMRQHSEATLPVLRAEAACITTDATVPGFCQNSSGPPHAIADTAHSSGWYAHTCQVVQSALPMVHRPTGALQLAPI